MEEKKQPNKKGIEELQPTIIKNFHQAEVGVSISVGDVQVFSPNDSLEDVANMIKLLIVDKDIKSYLEKIELNKLKSKAGYLG